MTLLFNMFTACTPEPTPKFGTGQMALTSTGGLEDWVLKARVTCDHGYKRQIEAKFGHYGAAGTKADAYFDNIPAGMCKLQVEIVEQKGVAVPYCESAGKSIEIKAGQTIPVFVDLICNPDETGGRNIVVGLCIQNKLGTPSFSQGKHLVVGQLTDASFTLEHGYPPDAIPPYQLVVQVKDQSLKDVVSISAVKDDTFRITCKKEGPVAQGHTVELEAILQQCGMKEVKQTFHIFCNPRAELCYEKRMTLPLKHHSVRRVLVADLNKDGHPDIVVNYFFSAYIGVLINKGDGTYHDEVLYSVPTIDRDYDRGATDIAIEDLDGDGHLDLLVTIYGLCYSQTQGDRYQIRYGKGDGTFGNAVDLKTGDANPMSILIGDFNRDGKKDFLITHNNGLWSASVLLNTGHRQWTRAHVYGYPQVGQNPQYTALADFNNDGWPDVVVGALYTGIFVLINKADGSGGFHIHKIDSTSYRHYVTVGDFNGDGLMDIAARTEDRTSNPHVAVFLNAGQNKFHPPVIYPVDGRHGGILMARDLDGTNGIDLIAPSHKNPLKGLAILTNKGDGTFEAPKYIKTAGDTFAVEVYDFNRDGLLDILVSDFTDRELSIFFAHACSR